MGDTLLDARDDLLRAEKNWSAARSALNDALRATFSPGTPISWESGGREYFGEVVEVLWNGRVVARNVKTGGIRKLGTMDAIASHRRQLKATEA